MAFWVPLLIFVGTTALSMLLRPKTPKPQVTLPPAPDEDTTLPIPVVYGTQRVPMRWIALDAQGMIQSTRGVYSFGIKVDTTTQAQHWWFQGSALLTYGTITQLVDLVFDDRFWLSEQSALETAVRIHQGYVDRVWGEGNVVIQVPVFTSAVAKGFGRGINLTALAPLPYSTGTAFGLDGGDLFGIRLPDLFGGDFGQGGVGGYFTMRYGMRYPDLPRRLGGTAATSGRDSTTPPWRAFTWVDFGLSEADAATETLLSGTRFFNPRGFRNGVVSYPPPIEFVITRLPVGPAGGVVDGADANPVTAIWELLTSPDIGLGMPEWMLDEASFHTAALWTGAGQPGTQETNPNYFGVSFTYDRERTGEDVIGALLETLDAVLYTDLTSGKLKIWLIREPTDTVYGYGTAADPFGGLAVLTPSTAKLVRHAKPESRELVNVVRVKYRDRKRKFADAVHVERNPASIAALGREQPLTIEPLGVCTRVIAERVAKRELRARSSGPRRATFELTRASATLHVGKQFLAAFPSRGLDGVVMRVVSLDWGTPDDPTIRLEAVEDVYGRPAVYTLSDPDPEPPDAAPVFRTPLVEEFRSMTRTHGVLYLDVADPDGLVTGLTWRTRSNADEWSPEIVGDLEDPVYAVALSASGEAGIHWTVSWTDPHGFAHTITGLADFGPSTGAVDALRPVVIEDGAGGFETVYDGDGNVVYH